MTRNDTQELGCDERLFKRLVKTTFNQRRKTLVNALSAAEPKLSKDDCERILKLCNFETNIRGEKLNLVDFARISNEIADLGTANL